MALFNLRGLLFVVVAVLLHVSGQEETARVVSQKPVETVPVAAHQMTNPAPTDVKPAAVVVVAKTSLTPSAATKSKSKPSAAPGRKNAPAIAAMNTTGKASNAAKMSISPSAKAATSVPTSTSTVPTPTTTKSTTTPTSTTTTSAPTSTMTVTMTTTTEKPLAQTTLVEVETPTNVTQDLKAGEEPHGGANDSRLQTTTIVLPLILLAAAAT